jgi:hypothetical protein
MELAGLKMEEKPSTINDGLNLSANRMSVLTRNLNRNPGLMRKDNPLS